MKGGFHISQEKPKYWGTWEGEIIKVLVQHDNEFVNFKILEAKTGLTPNGLKKALPTLYNDKIIQKDGESANARYLLIDDNTKIEWKKFLETDLSKESNQKDIEEKSNQEKNQVPQKKAKSELDIILQEKPSPEESEDTLIKWLIQWATDKPINLAVKSKQFFIEGLRLTALAMDLIGKAKDEILVTSPFVDSCHPITSLTEAKDRRVNIRIVTTRPTKDKSDAKKVECHALLRKKGVNIHYISNIHAKIIIIDNKVTIVSSMNLYSGSTGGGLLEAGIVSFENKVVESASKYINDLLAQTESPDITSYNKYWRNR